MKKLLIAFSAIVLLVSSCKKDKDEAAAPVTPTKENLVGTYKTTKIVIKSSQGEADVTNQMMQAFEVCDRDNLHKLNADNTYQWVDAGTKCDPESSYSDSWTLTNSTTISIDAEAYTIKSFNGTVLELSQNMGTAETIYTYTKQ